MSKSEQMSQKTLNEDYAKKYKKTLHENIVKKDKLKVAFGDVIFRVGDYVLPRYPNNDAVYKVKCVVLSSDGEFIYNLYNGDSMIKVRESEIKCKMVEDDN